VGDACHVKQSTAHRCLMFLPALLCAEVQTLCALCMVTCRAAVSQPPQHTCGVLPSFMGARSVYILCGYEQSMCTAAHCSVAASVHCLWLHTVDLCNWHNCCVAATPFAAASASAVHL
jgi:hypothetical protein